MNNEQMSDQFAFKPTGSTTAAIIELLHIVLSMLDQGNDYVRCILIDYSKAFDVVNHEILLQELSNLGLTSSIFNWIADFLTGRSQAVKLGDIISAFLFITRSIVQGSGLGPYLFILLARKLKTLSLINRLVKYADDMTLIVPQKTDCSIETEFRNIIDWSCLNKQNINTAKTKEIIFWRSGYSSRSHPDVPAIPLIERVHQVRLLGVILTSNLSFTPSHWLYIISHLTEILPAESIKKNVSRWCWPQQCVHCTDCVTHSLCVSGNLWFYFAKWHRPSQRYVQKGQTLGYNCRRIWYGPSVHIGWFWTTQKNSFRKSLPKSFTSKSSWGQFA